VSSVAIRNAAAALVADASWTAVAPFFETINKREPASLPDLWSSLAFSAHADEAISIGSPTVRREAGVVTVGVFGLAGLGASAVDAAVASLRALAAGWTWPAGMRVLRVGPPIDADPAAALGWHRVELEVAYTFDYVSS